MAGSYYPKIVTEGMVLCLDGGNRESYPGSGATWSDVSGNNNNATLVNSPTYTTANVGTISLNGSTQYATIPVSDTMKPATALTQEVWIRLNSLGLQVFFALQYGTSSNNAYCLWYQDSLLRCAINTSGVFNSLTSIALSTGVWYHLVHSWNGTTRSLYVNTTLVASESRTGIIFYDSSNTLATIGIDYEGTGYNAGASWYTNGSVSQVKLYNRGLSLAEIRQNFNATRGRFGV